MQHAGYTPKERETARMEEVESLRADLRHEKEQARIADENFNHACDEWRECEKERDRYLAALNRIFSAADHSDTLLYSEVKHVFHDIMGGNQ